MAPGGVGVILAQTTLWLILRANLPVNGPVKVFLRWVSRGGGPPEPVVELAQGGDIRVYSLFTRKSSAEASAFYEGAAIEHPTVAYVKLSAQKAKNTSPHRDRQRKRLHLVSENTTRALPAPDEDASHYAKLRTDRKGRLLPEAKSPQIRGLLTGPKG